MWNESAYDPYNSGSNGVQGEFGQINLRVDRQVDLKFCLVKQLTSNGTLMSMRRSFR